MQRCTESIVLFSPISGKICAVLAGLCLGLAWLVPGTFSAVVLGWIVAVATAILLNCPYRQYRYIYFLFVTANFIAHYWLVKTIVTFGGLPYIAAVFIYLSFVAINGLQGPLFLWIWRRLPLALSRIGIGYGMAWVVIELVPLSIFPWSFGATQLRFASFIQSSDIFGIAGVSFLMFYFAGAIVEMLARNNWRQFTLAVFVFAINVGYGLYTITYYQKILNQERQVAIVQANLSVEQKNNVAFFSENRARYLALTDQANLQNTLIVWPETVVQDWILDTTDSLAEDHRLPLFNNGSNNSFIIGALTFRQTNQEQHIFNSALVLSPDGHLYTPYHKRILMPFGEYVPLANIFPWLRRFVNIPIDFTPGAGIMMYPISLCNKVTDCADSMVATMICYEDLLAGPSRDAAKSGANLLVSLSNDGWFGDTVAPYQHHVLAAVRAIENKRYLVRSTNTGLTGVIDPIGRTTASIKPFTEGVLVEHITPLSVRTLYQILGDWPIRCLAFITVLLALFGRRLPIGPALKYPPTAKSDTLTAN